MAEITRQGIVTPSSTNPPPSNLVAFKLAGEAILAGDNCYVKPDESVWKTNTAAPGVQNRIRGQACAPASVGEAVTLGQGLRFLYSSALTPGSDVFASATVPGGLADVTSANAPNPCGYVVDGTRVQFFHPR